MTKNYLLLALLGMLLSLSGALEARDPLSSDTLSFERPLRIACPKDTPPFSFVDDQGDLKGITIDVWRLWAEKIGVDIRFIPAIWEDTLSLLRDGRADIHSSLMFHEERETWLEFAAPIASTTVNFFFHRTLFGVERLEDLRAFKIGVMSGSYLEAYVREQLPDATLITYPTFDELLAAAERGDIRVFVRSVENTLWELQQHGLTEEFRFHPERPLHRHPFWAVVPKGQTTLAAAIRQGMDMITPEERAAIERRWLGTATVKTPETLIVAIDAAYPPLTLLNTDGQPAGLFVDIWRLWSQKTGKPVEFRPGTWNETLNSIKNGEADAHAGLFFSDARAEWLSFSQPFYGVSSSFFYAAESQGFDSAADLTGITIGATRSSYQEEYMRRRYPHAEVIAFTTRERMIRAVLNGEIRAFLAEQLTMRALITQLGLSGKIISDPQVVFTKTFHVGVLKDHPDILKAIDEGFNAISNAELADIEAHWVASLQERYYPPTSSHLRLTTAENVWLKAHRSVRVGIVPECPPIALRSPQEEIVGITPDYLRLLGERTGIRFDLIPVHPSELSSSIRSQTVDLIPSFELPERETSMNLTRPFRTVSWVIVSRDETPLVHDVKALQGKKIAINRGVKLLEILTQKYPQMIVVPVETPLEALQAVSSGQADACIIELSIAGYLFRQFRLSNLKITGLTRYTDLPMIFAVRNDWPELLSILNKAIDSISLAESERIEQTWIPLQVEQIVDWTLVWQWSVGVGSVVGLILALSLVWNRRLTREIAERKRAMEELQRIEWLLTRGGTPSDTQEESYQPPYGDVTELNTCRVILDAVGRETLKQIAQDTIDLLDTSVAVYERNGDYAFGMFSSGWCRFFDLASRKLCGDVGNREALACGRWLCHENCWNDSARAAMQSGQPTDIECIGGVHLYGVPIAAGDEIVGVINIGYGDPPADDATVSKLAQRFNVSVEEIRACAADYQSRPPYIIELAKKRLQTAADLIGEIVERKRIEEALRESEARFRRQFESTPIPTFIWKYEAQDFVLIDYNSAADRLTEGTAHQFIGLSATEIYPDRPDLLQRFHACREQQNVIEYETLYQARGTGLDRLIVFTYTYVPTNLIMLHTEDVTDRRQAEEALQQSQTLLMEAERLAQVGAWEWDIRSDIFICSAEWQRIHGVQQSRILVKDLLPIAHPDDRERIQTAWQDALAEMKPYDIEHRIIRQDTGEERVIQAYGEVFGNTKGQPLKMYGAAQDITERKQAEQQLKDALHEKEVLLREIHHRVKNNMMVVTSLIQMQADQTTDQNTLALFRDLYNRVLSMAMVHEDLYQSRDLAQIDFGTYLERLVINIRSGFAKNRAVIKIEADGILLDLHKAIPCGLIVAELVTNAFKYAFVPTPDPSQEGKTPPHPSPKGRESLPLLRRGPGGGSEIRVEMRKEENAYTLIVSDNGVGLPPDFDLQKQRTLGMTLVRSWATHQLKGKIAIDSQQGTRFSIRFM